MNIVALDHIQLAMPAGREDEARAFYQGLLGLHEVPKPVQLQSRGGCWFAGDGIALHLGVEKDFMPARKAHPAFRVSNLEAARQHLAHAGVAITPDDALPHVRRFYIADPFGNRIEILQDGDVY
ncbi:MAG: VOC family protein [Herpetosiphon sp.]|nr:VOC family protein [Herpetosiphon sp.]